MSGILKEETLRYLRSLRDIPKSKQGELNEACVAILAAADPDIYQVCDTIGLLLLRIPEIQKNKNKMQALLFLDRTGLLSNLELSNKMGSSRKK